MMTTYIRRHYRDSSFIPFVDLADLEQHVRWLAQQRDTSAGPLRLWLNQTLHAAETELHWRKNRHLIEVQESET